MSAETYIATRTRSRLTRIDSKVPEYEGPSVIWPRAQELIEEGVEGLRFLESRVAALSVPSPSERTVFSSAMEHVTRNVRLNQAAILAGVGLHSIEEMLVTARFSEPGFVRAYHQAVGDSPLALDLWAKESDPVEVDPSANTRLLELARRDRSLTELFSPEALRLAPAGLGRLLDESGTLDDIRILILPTYRDKAPMAKAA